MRGGWQYIRALLHDMGTILTADEDRRTTAVSSPLTADPSLEYVQIEMHSLRHSDDDEAAAEDEPSVEDILANYKAVAEEHWMRPIQWTRDLYFNMQSFYLDGHRYWIMDLSHPLSCILEHAARNDGRPSPAVKLARFNLGRGAIVTHAVYQDEPTMGDIMRELVDRFFGQAIYLMPPVVDAPASTPTMAEPVAVVPPPEVSIVIPPAPIVVSTSRPEGSKKSD